MNDLIVQNEYEKSAAKIAPVCDALVLYVSPLFLCFVYSN